MHYCYHPLWGGCDDKSILKTIERTEHAKKQATLTVNNNPNGLSPMKYAAYRLLFLGLFIGFCNYLLAGEVQDQIARLKDRDYQVQKSAAATLINLGNVSVEPLITCMKDLNVDRYARCGAAFALGELHDERAVAPLIACLEDPDVQVLKCAIDALGSLGDPRAVVPLITCLKDRDRDVRSRAANALVKLIKTGKNSVEPLIACLNDQDINVYAINALGKIGDRSAVDSLIVCLKNQDQNVRLSAVNALGEIGNTRAVAPLLACLKDQDINVRSSAFRALCVLGDKASLVSLIAFLINSGGPEEGFNVGALANFGKPAVEPLIAFLKSQDSFVRSEAAKALGKLGDARAVKPLIACLNDQDGAVRESAFDAVDSLGAINIGVLVEVLPDWDLRTKIGVALNKLNWKPTGDADLVYFWICNGNGTSLKKNWDKTKQVLLADVHSGEQRKVKNAVYTFVSLGNQEIISDLHNILYTQGDREMAVTYLNCGNHDLAKAAESWASSHGYQLSSGGSGGEASWGGW